MKVKQLKKGDFFTKKQIDEPTDNQVWVRGDYIREEKKYECVCYGDANRYVYIKGNKEVFTEFTF